MNLFQFLQQMRDKYTQMYDYSTVPQTRKNSNPLKYIEAYIDNKWTFLSKLINPKSYIEFMPTPYGMYMKDVKNIFYNTMEGGFSCSKLWMLKSRIKVFEAKWDTLPEKKHYEQLNHDLFHKESVSSISLISLSFVQSIMEMD
jgi:hypothetical protein